MDQAFKHLSLWGPYLFKPPCTHNKITGINKDCSLVTFNIDSLDSPTERYKQTEWLQKQNPFFCCIQGPHLNIKDIHHLRVNGWKKTFQANGPKKQASFGDAVLISDKLDFKSN